MNVLQHITANELPLTVYPLSMARDYVRHWGLSEAIREILQNAIDSKDSPFEFEFGEDWLKIVSSNAYLEPSTLVLGSTSKADDKESIGSFGEGYKLALLVLTRLGYTVHIENRERLWLPVFKHSEQFGIDMLYIEEYSCTTNDHGGLAFVVGGLSWIDMQSIRESCLQMQPDIEDVIEVPQGRILPSLPGKLYVNGLFVCTTELENSYDVKPDYLTLERDRQTVDGFKLKWLAKDMWFAANQPKVVAKMIVARSPDLEYANHYTPAEVKEEVYHEFARHNPGSVIARSPEHARELEEVQYTKPVYISTAMHDIVSTSDGYKKQFVTAIVVTPQMKLQAWLDSNKKYLRRLPKVAFKKLIDDAKAWKS